MHDFACAGIRDHVVQAVELKFNCFFLMPVVDAFPTRLREELEQAYEEDLDEVFDVAAVRCALESRLRSLESELHQVCARAYLSQIEAVVCVWVPSVQPAQSLPLSTWDTYS